MIDPYADKPFPRFEQTGSQVEGLTRRRMIGRYIVLVTILGCLLLLLFTTVGPHNFKLWRLVGLP